MSKEKFTTLKSTAVPLPIENIDTDQIIPARFLKATTREGFGENLFRDWRYNSDDITESRFRIERQQPIQDKILGSRKELRLWQ